MINDVVINPWAPWVIGIVYFLIWIYLGFIWSGTDGSRSAAEWPNNQYTTEPSSKEKTIHFVSLAIWCMMILGGPLVLYMLCHL